MPIIGIPFIQVAYSIADMAWVGRLGNETIATIGAVGILIWTTNSISYLNEVGSEMSVGQGIEVQNVEDAQGFASHNLAIILILPPCWGLLLFVFVRPIIDFYKLEEPIALNAVEYLRIIASVFPFIFLSAAFTGIHNVSGSGKILFYISGTDLLLNVVPDPLFILDFHLGTVGAAQATRISQAVVRRLFVCQLKRHNKLFGEFPLFVHSKEHYAERISQLDLPVALLDTSFAIINLSVVRTTSTYGGCIGLMTLTADGRMEAIAWNISQGFSVTLSAFTVQNYAVYKKERILTVYHMTLKMISIIGAFCTLPFIFYGSEVFPLIVSEQVTYEAGGIFLRIDGYSMILMILEITVQGIFYSTGRIVPLAIISISCNTLRIPLAIGLAVAGLGITDIQWTTNLSSMLKGIIAFIRFSILQKKVL